MSVIHANLEGGTTIFSLDPDRGPADRGEIPLGITVLAMVNLADPGYYPKARVQEMHETTVMVQDSFLGSEGPVATSVRSTPLRNSLQQVDCNGVMLYPNSIFYAHRNSFRHHK